MKTSSAKAKGRRAAQEVKSLLLQYCMDLAEDDLNVTTSGDTGEDIKMSPKAREYYPFAIEVKNVEKLNIWDALEQARSHSKVHAPLLFFKRNNTQLKVALDATTFLAMMAHINEIKINEKKSDK